jgi:hypothetical protein
MSDIWDGLIIELRPEKLRRRWDAFRYGRGEHAAVRSPLQGAAAVLGGVVTGTVALLAGVAVVVAGL